MTSFFEMEVTLINEQGLHLRTAQQFAKVASRFDSEIEVFNGNFSANGKSFMNLIALLAYKGTVLKIRAMGEDAEEAVSALVRLVKSGFSEDKK